MASDEKSFKITAKKTDNFSEWYTQVLIKSGFLDYSAVSGMIVLRPDGYFVWDAVRNATDMLFNEEGILNVYFPLLIPESLLNKEKEHIVGFAPEVAWVTESGNSKLDERLAVRPTSEAIMYDNFSRWIQSWRDLPLKYNQWNSVVRWEFKHPAPLLRGREFLWNEGHTVYASEKEADTERDVILRIYSKVLKEYFALDGIPGRKTDKEKFAGAQASYSIEMLMPDGWAIQGPVFHSDGQNFSKVFNIQFLDKEGKNQYPCQNTFAISTRVMGVMVAVHGDDKGLVLPPKLARIQVAIVPIYKDENRDTVLAYAKKISKKIKNKRVFLDDRDSYSPGWKFNEWEAKGTPIRLEIGEKEVKGNTVTTCRRDNGAKALINSEEINENLDALIESIHNNMYEKAKKLISDNVFKVNDYDGLKKVVTKGGFAQAPWCGSMECEDKIREKTGAKATNMPFRVQDEAKGKKCIYCGKEAKHIVNFAKSY